MWVESSYNPRARGDVGEIGLMQVRPATAALLGFTGSLARLAEPATNIAYGARYLAQAWRLAQGDVCTTVMKYRAGHGETRFQPRSVELLQPRASASRTHAPPGRRFRPCGWRRSPVIPLPERRIAPSRKAVCFRRVVQPGRRFGACIPRSVLAKKGLLRKG